MKRGYAGIGIYQPKNAKNIGAILRASGCYGVSFVAVEGCRYDRSQTDTQKAYKHIPLFEVVALKNSIPKDCVPVAVDFVDGARNLYDYVHPERAFYIFGGEDRTLSEEVLEWCRDKVYMPTKYCMNLSAAVNTLLYDRGCKRREVYD